MLYSEILISSCTNTTKYWLRAIIKENELASFIVWPKLFAAFIIHNDSVAQPSAYVARQVICRKFCRIILPRFILTFEG